MQPEKLQALAQLPSPVLTLYLNTASGDPSRHPRVAASADWLQKEAGNIARGLSWRDAKIFLRQVNRVKRFFENRIPKERALVLFAAPKHWRLLPLPFAVDNQLHWGEPSLGQLVRLANMHKSYGVVVIDHQGVRFFGHSMDGLLQLAHRSFQIDASQWKQKDFGHISSERIRKTRGEDHDLYEARIEAQFARLCRETAAQASDLSTQHGFAALFLVGPDRMIRNIRAKLAHPISESAMLVAENLGKFSAAQVLKRLQPVMEDYEQAKQLALVTQLLDAGATATVGPDETLSRLQKGTVRMLVVSSDLNMDLRQCERCGLANRSGDPLCADCKGALRKVTFQELLPTLLTAHNVTVEFVHGPAAALLRRSGGIAGWLRLAKAASARRTA